MGKKYIHMVSQLLNFSCSQKDEMGKEWEGRGGTKGVCYFGMLLLNLCTWEQACLFKGFSLWFWWGNMLWLTQHWVPT